MLHSSAHSLLTLVKIKQHVFKSYYWADYLVTANFDMW